MLMQATISVNSWGGTGYSQALYDAMLDLGSQGHMFVVSAGNGPRNDLGANIGVNNDLGFAGASSMQVVTFVLAIEASAVMASIAICANLGCCHVETPASLP